jgi:hypothetical protein
LFDRSTPRWLALPFVALVLAGCAGRTDRPQPVAGQVFVDGQPAARAQVTLHPLDERIKERPAGHADEQGRFRLTTAKDGDGAPPGKYRVSVVWFVAVPVGRDESVARNRLPARYADATTSGLEATVTPGTNDLPAFRLSSR